MSTSQLPHGEGPGDSLAQVLNYQSHTNICTRSLVERGEQHIMTTLCIPSSARMYRLVGQPGQIFGEESRFVVQLNHNFSHYGK